MERPTHGRLMEVNIDWDYIQCHIKDLEDYFKNLWGWHAHHPGLVVHEFNAIHASDLDYRWQEIKSVLEPNLISYLKNNFFKDDHGYLEFLRNYLLRSFPEINRVYLNYSSQAFIDIQLISDTLINSKILLNNINPFRNLGEDIGIINRLEPQIFQIEIKWAILPEMDAQVAAKTALRTIVDIMGAKNLKENPLVIPCDEFYDQIANLDFVRSLNALFFVSEGLKLKTISCNSSQYLELAEHGHRFINGDQSQTIVNDYKVYYQKPEFNSPPPKKATVRINKHQYQLEKLKDMLPSSVNEYFESHLSPENWDYLSQWWNQLSDIYHRRIKAWIDLTQNETLFEQHFSEWILNVLGWQNLEDFYWSDLTTDKKQEFKMFFLELLKEKRLDFEKEPRADHLGLHSFYRIEAFYFEMDKISAQEMYFFTDGMKLRPNSDSAFFASSWTFQTQIFELIRPVTEHQLKAFKTTLLKHPDDLQFNVMVDEEQMFYVEMFLNDHAIWNATKRFQSFLACYEEMEIIQLAWNRRKPMFAWKEYYQCDNHKVDMGDYFKKVFVVFNTALLNDYEINSRWNCFKKHVALHLNLVPLKMEANEYQDVLVKWKKDSLSFEDSLPWLRK